MGYPYTWYEFYMKKKEKYGNMGFIFYLVIAHQSKHLKGLDMLLPKKNI